MQNSLIAIGALLVFSLSASATTYKFSASASVDSQGNVVFKVASAGDRVAPINDFAIVGVTDGEWDYQHPLWNMSAAPGAYVDLSEITYGSAVAGFRSTDAKPLVAGQRYLAGIAGAGISDAYEFEIEKRDGKTFVKMLGHALDRPR
jgi:hypothetical protein